jgi:putative FmdB family regulatory protein
MPIYEYQCEDCKNEFEYLAMGNYEPEGCPSCKGENVHRLMSACGFMSKGSGGETVGKSAGASACGGCTGTSCAGCGH